MKVWHWYRDHYWGFRGRVRRLDYVTYSLGALFIAVLIGIGIQYLPDDLASFILLIPAIAALILLALGNVSLATRRFHDLGLPGYAFLAYIVVGAAVSSVRPVVDFNGMTDVSLLSVLAGLLWTALPFVLPGSRGFNKYGPPPKLKLDPKLNRRERRDPLPRLADMPFRTYPLDVDAVKRRGRAPPDGPPPVGAAWAQLVRRQPLAQRYYDQAWALDVTAAEQLVKAMLDRRVARDWDAILNDVKSGFERRALRQEMVAEQTA